MSATNRMPKTTPWQAVQRIPIKSATIRQSETSLQQVHYYTTNWTNGDWAIQKQRPLRRKMSENDENLFPWQRPLRNGDPVSQESSTPVGLPAGEKNGEGRSRTFWADRTRRSSTNRNKFWLSGSPEVITDGAIRQKTKFPTFSFPSSTVFLSRVVFELRRKKRNFGKRKLVAMATSLKNSKTPMLRSFIYSHSGTERWKPRENPSYGSIVEVKGLTEIVKKERKKIRKLSCLLLQYRLYNYTVLPGLTKLVFVVFAILFPIMLLNMLIAMIANTYQQIIRRAEKEWIRQVRARVTELAPLYAVTLTVEPTVVLTTRSNVVDIRLRPQSDAARCWVSLSIRQSVLPHGE